MAVVAIDAGTTMIKAVAYDAEGTELAMTRRPTAVTRPRPGHAEQDMGEVWDAVMSCIRSVLAELAEPVDALALTAQGDGCWLVDSDLRPTGPAVLWNDGRSEDIVAGWRAGGVLDEAFRRTGCMGFSGLPNAVLTWLAEQDQDRLQRSAAALTCGGWLFANLTGELAMDHSEAAAPWLDVLQGTYADELLDLYGMPWARRLLPPLRHDDDRVAPVRPEAATALGIAPDTPVVLSSYDIASTAIGVGVVDDRQACSVLGTTLCTEAVTSQPDLRARPVGLTIPLGAPGRYLRAFPTLAGCDVLDWSAELLGLADAAELCTLAATAPAGARGLSFLPYLSPAGERVPFLDAAARGSFAGLSFDHDRACVARAIVEGLTFVIRDCLAECPVAPVELRLCGGGANSAEWGQLIADLTGVPTLRPADAEVGAKGAFLMAQVATGRATDLPSAVAAYVRPAGSYEPAPDTVARYDELFAAFRAARAHAAADWHRLREVGA
ncbi:MAG: carbohydrate kinase [Streptosporangiales bacterium]|nr:carbohydrate kinase [Streptosporangiales bacterium]